MKTDKVLKTISKYSLQMPSSNADERIEGIMQKRITALQSVQKNRKSQNAFSYLIWKYMFSSAAGIAVLIFVLNLSITKDSIPGHGLLGTTNSLFANLTAITNNDARYSRTKAQKFDIIPLQTTCEGVSLNYWRMVSIP